MSRTLILFRHGKSDWDAGAEIDHERPLARRGIKAAQAMGRMLAEVGQLPDIAITSTATRAATTLNLAAEAGGWPIPIERTRTLYATTPDAVLTFIKQLSGAHRSVMLVGHETTWSELVALLTGGGNLRFPTAAMARIDFPGEDWCDTRAGVGQLAWFIPPRFLGRSKANP